MKNFFILLVLGVIAAAAIVFVYPELIKQIEEEPVVENIENKLHEPVEVSQDNDTNEIERKPKIRYPIPGINADVAPVEQKSSSVSKNQPLKKEKQQPLPLPAMDKSDNLILQTLGVLFKPSLVKKMFKSSDIIPRIVVTVDNLLNKNISVEQFPTTPVRGTFIVKGKEGQQVISKRNYRRYALYIKMLNSLNVKALVKSYIYMYPLFQQAYQDLGYQDVYFNDRLVDVIDDLIAAPEIEDPVKLIRKSVMFKYADPQLEALSSGQKIMIRMGLDNAKQVKKVLASIRELLIIKA